MTGIPFDILEGNESFVTAAERRQPGLFDRLVREQRPDCFVLACSDSRVSPSVVTRAPLGSMFIHRNVANQVTPDDPSLSAGLYYALTQLQVRTVVILGHTHCGGIAAAAADGRAAPPLEGWLEHVRAGLGTVLERGGSVEEQARQNVQEQVRRMRGHPVYQAHGASVPIEGYLFDLQSGRLERVGAG